LDDVCAPGYTGRKRGERVRTRTTVSQAHSYHWLGSFGNRGNGRYREELRKGLAAIRRYLAAAQFPQERTLLRLDGQYGTGAVLCDVAGFAFVTRGKDYNVLDHPLIQARLHLPPDQSQQRPESQTVRSLYDCPQIPVGSAGVSYRVVVATHTADQNGKKKKTVGVTRAGVVYELFFTNLPQHAFTASDVVELYLHRGAFEPTLADEDQEIDPDRWCSYSAWGQEAWQCVAQWTWNLRLELGHHLKPEPVRTTEFAPALPPPREQAATHSPSSLPASGYGPPTTATSWKAGRFKGADFPLQPDGTLLCPAGRPLHPHEHRRETDGSLRVVYGASLANCRPCALREHCQWDGDSTKKSRQVSLLLHPLAVGSVPLLWQDWGRRVHRRACIHLLRHQRVAIRRPSAQNPTTASPSAVPVPLSRAERAHTRLSWEQRFIRNAHPQTGEYLTITLFGVPRPLATWIGLAGA